LIFGQEKGNITPNHLEDNKKLCVPANIRYATFYGYEPDALEESILKRYKDRLILK
jgi:hypothetical protein